MARTALFALSLALLLVAARAGSPITSSSANEKPDQSSKKVDGLMTELPADIAKQAASGNAAGLTYVDTAQDSFFMADVKKAGWNAQKCPPGLNKELAGACTPKNCSKGGIAAKWKTAYLQKNKLGYELYVPGNPLTLLKANPASCCNTCAATPLCTYWQYIPDITIDGKKGKGACYLIHDQIDFTCGEMTAQYSTETKPVPLQVRIGGECNPSAKILNDPHLVGAHGTHFDFNGRPDKAFCLLTDRDLHVNMLLRGYYDERTDNAALVVDGKAVHTWIKELGMIWTAKGVDHKVRIAARGGKQQERGDGFVKSIEIDGEAIPRMQVGDSVTSDGGLTIQFRALEKEGPFDVDYYLLTIDGLISLDLRLRVAHPKLQTPSDAEAHINVGIAELEHTDAIHGVLGQTYRDDHSQRATDFQKLIASLHRPISADGAEGQGFLDGTPRSYEASDVLAVDCAYTAYGRARQVMPVQEFPSHHRTMPRVTKKTVKPVTKSAVSEVMDLAAKGHQSEPATPKPQLKDVEGPFDGGVRASLAKRLSALKFPSSDAPVGDGDNNANEGQGKEEEVNSPTAAPDAPEEGGEDEEEEDDGYLSDDPEERFDPVKAGEIAARAGFSITLLVPIKYEEEVPRTIDTVKGLLALWRKFMSAHVPTTTRCQVLLPAWLSKKRYGRMQVTFQQASDANYVWCRQIQHKMLNEESIYLDWQHPENPVYIQERATNPDSIEVLLKSVPAAITSEMVYEYLVKTVLEKRGRTPFLSGAAFHRVVDPVTGADTDKIRGLVKGHPGDKYRWWHLLVDSEACGKAHGSSFTQALAHVKSVQHCTAILQGDAASRKSRGKMNFFPIRKEFGL
ncbi:unnamed protein product [Closterium sp. Naga37s-1]|nr:unnamed protein product [Closterium sp. Naga37s-1]